MENKFNQFDEYDEKRSAAYLAFLKEFEDENPQPVRGKVERSDWFIPVALFVLVAASIYVSANRTIEEFGGGSVGLAAFIMVDIAVIAFAFYITRMNVNTDRVAYTRRMAWAGVFLAFFVAIAANLSDVLRKHGVYVSPDVATILNGLVAVSAPTLAFISGHILAVEYLKFSRRDQELDKRLEEAQKQYKADRHKAWQSRKRQWGIKIESEPVKAVNPVHLTDKQPQKRASKQLDQAIEWLIANPGNLDVSSRDLVEQIGVSYVTIYKAQQIVKAEHGYQNGHAQ